MLAAARRLPLELSSLVRENVVSNGEPGKVMGIFNRRRADPGPGSAPANGSRWFTDETETATAQFRSGGGLPVNIVDMMDQFGRFEFDPLGQGVVAAGDVWPRLVSPLMPLAQADQARFLRHLAAALLPAGGWAVYGGERLVKELFRGDLDDPSYHAMMSAALAFLRSQGVPLMRLNGYEKSFWHSTQGQTEEWLLSRPAPDPQAAPITPLHDGERRRIAQLESDPKSNAIYVRRDSETGYVASIDARWSDEDPRRVENDWHSASTLYSLYVEIGRSLGVPSHWCDPELEPYFPFDRPKIDWLPGSAPVKAPAARPASGNPFDAPGAAL